ncbi:MAG TPA: protein kinase [Bryobacteraceae bacterium]|nr:protein kinase [Bryobacteraceae bacterium]
MTAERWKQIEALYHSALEYSPHERAAFIADACKGDPDLINEVEDLVRRDESPGWSLHDSPVWAAHDEPGAPLAAGARLGPYEIVNTIGSGGMGVVFRAIDTRLGRSVAIKTSRGAFSDRFAREARTIAALNHPNICTLYDTGPDYLVMELIEGPTLADRIRRGPLPFDEAMRIARQMADAIEAAHESGIVHRDLKPANIKFRLDGAVKVLDFGLAKSTTRTELAPDSLEVKLSGMILGTAAYMSPEQALGQEVDKRSDIWAFGVVLYEMLTGSRPFDGATVSDCIADIVRNEPDLAKVPARVRRLLGLCLEKDPQKRLRSLGDWQHLIEPEELRQQSSGASRFRKIAWIAVPTILIAAAAGIWSARSRPAGSLRPARFQVNLPEEIYFDKSVSVSPDGQNLVFSATGEKDGLWIHNLDTLEWRRLPGAEHGKSPFWSPDSRYLGFVVSGNAGSEVKKIYISGGSAATIYTAPGHWLGEGSWNQNGDLIIGGPNGEPIRKISSNGGAEAVLSAVDSAHGEASHGRPQFLPDGRHFLYWVAGSAERKGMYSGSVDDAAAQPRERLVTVPARYASGKLLFQQGPTLMAQTFDAERRRLTGEPAPIADRVQTIDEQPVVSASAAVLAYRPGPESPGKVLTWYDRHSKELGTVGQPGSDVDPKISPDQQHLAVIDGGSGMTNIWIRDFATGLRTRFTFQPPVASPAWSRDGRRLFYSSGPKLEAISVKNADGSGPETELFRQPGSFLYPTSISPDERFLLYFASTKPRGMGVHSEVWVLPLAKDGHPFRLLGSEFSNVTASFSPDGRWIAWKSNESGRTEVYLRGIVNAGPGGLSLGPGKWQVSREGAGGALPIWRRDGKELFYMSAQDVITAVTVDSSHGALQLGNPIPLVTTPCTCQFDVTADGQRFLVSGPAGATSKAPITVVLNWQAELKTQ